MTNDVGGVNNGARRWPCQSVKATSLDGWADVLAFVCSLLCGCFALGAKPTRRQQCGEWSQAQTLLRV
jgi:hypothetical protein